MKKQACKVLSILLVLAMALSLVGGCSNSNDPNEGEASSSPQTGNQTNTNTGTNTIPGSVLNVVATEDMPTLTPLKNSSQVGYTISYNVYEGLLQAYKGDWNDIRPWLAERYEVSDDGLEYVFYLRQGVKFHDGSDFDAADVIASFDYLQGNQPSFFVSIDSYEALDEYTVAVHMNQTYAYFLNLLCSVWFKILSADALEAYGDSDNRCAVGTGPFYIESYATGDKVITKAFQDYWNQDDIPYIETVNYNIITDSNTAFLALQSDQVDFMPYVSSLQYTTAEADPSLQTYVVPNSCNWVLGLNTNVAPLDKVEVRQAIDCFLDKEAINMAGFDGLGFATNSTYVEESGVYADMGHTYDVDKGLNLLESVGLKPSDISLQLKSSTVSYQKAMAENIQSQLMSVGMNVELVTMDFGPLNETRVTGDFEMNLYDTGGNLYNPLGSITQMVLSTGIVCTSFFKNTLPGFQAEADAMIASALAAPNAAEATALGQKVMEFYQPQVPWIPLVGSYVYHLSTTRLSDVVVDINIAGYPTFQYAKISS